jgi:type II secretory pathway predicted ATPase ExeA
MTHIRKSQFTPASSDEQARRMTAGFVSFGKRYELSPRALAAACGGYISKSSADRFYRGVSVMQLTKRTKPHVINALREFLAGHGLTAERIRQELMSMFSAEEIAPMIAPRIELSLDAQEHFGLRRDPFTGLPRASEETFTNRQLNAVASRVIDAVNYQGFIAVIGEIGCGKTALKIRVNEELRRRGRAHIVWPRFAVMARVEAGAIVASVLEHFDVKPRRGLVAMERQLEKLLAHLNDQGVRVALGFDECHRLNDTTLSALKNFYELGEGYDRFVGVVLFGQPLFRGRMQSYEFREIAERLQIIEMPGLGKSAWDYVAHRVRLAGGDAERIFERAAVTRLAAHADTPLALGNLCNEALERAYAAGEKRVPAALVKSDGREPQVRGLRRASRRRGYEA